MTARTAGDLDHANQDRPDQAGVDKGRLDKWLWHARFFRSRSLATEFCAEGRLRCDGVVVDKPHHGVRPGNVLTFPLGRQIRVIEILALASRRGPAVTARTLYRDLDPPTPENRLHQA